MKRFEGQVGVVTGAASGLGLVIAQQLLKEGAQVAVLDQNQIQLAHHFSRERNSIQFVIDLTDESAVQQSVDQVLNAFGQIDILINCAGITGITNVKSHQVDSKNLQSVFEVNFMSSFYTSKAVLPAMLAKQYGRILHIASIAGKEGNAGMLAYSASKAALIGMTKVQGKEYAEAGITINAMAPAVIQTPLVDAMPVAQVEYMTSKIPMKRCGTLEEATDLALFIVSKASSFTTGFTYDLSGGRATY
jgi:NAD(P)-dependent dehydrogenase (short-subunit alcohol dehydrogenase family)